MPEWSLPTKPRLLKGVLRNKIFYPPIGYNDVVWTDPTVDTTIPPQDTQSAITMVDDNPDYYGTHTFRYSRLDVGKLFADINFTVFSETAVSLKDLSADIFQQYGVFMTADDIVDGALPEKTSGNGVQLTLTISPDSFNYEGSVSFLFTRGIPDISNLITAPYLPVMVWPDPRDATAYDATQATWSYDFSQFSALLETFDLTATVDSSTGGNSTTMSRLRNYGLAQGIPWFGWTSAAMGYRYDTTDPALNGKGNTAFDRVFLVTATYNASANHSNTGYSLVKGTLYFHYNI